MTIGLSALWLLRAPRRLESIWAKEQKQLANSKTPIMTHPYECFRMTTLNLTLEYPNDAEEHFREIHSARKEWLYDKPHCVKDFCGPWIENYWIQHFQTIANKSSSASTLKLEDTFGPYIPLLIPWVDRWVEKQHGYPQNFVTKLRSVLRPDVAYVTVSQSNEGMLGFFAICRGIFHWNVCPTDQKRTCWRP